MISTRSAALLIDTVVCLTLAKWETVSGQFGGYLKRKAISYIASGKQGGRITMSKWTKLAAAGALSLCTAVQALAGSVTQPGETVGLNTGAPLPQGWYVINTVDWGCRNTNPQHTCTGLTIPVVAWSTPWTIF